MKTIGNRKEYVQPLIGTAFLSDSLMDQGWLSWVVDDSGIIPVDTNPDDDDEPEDAKSFTFDSNWETWKTNEFGWY